MSFSPSTKSMIAYRIRRAAVKTGQNTHGFRGIMNLRGLF
jgi:hypothetical protein